MTHETTRLQRERIIVYKHIVLFIQHKCPPLPQSSWPVKKEVKNQTLKQHPHGFR